MTSATPCRPDCESREGTPRASILVAAYEHPDFLRRTLLAFSRQTVKDVEIIVCDDGSGSSIKEVLLDVAANHRMKVRHCWHSKSGFRKCRILNEGVIQARGEYLIFADADCIPHRRFVEAHLGRRSAGHYLVGRRVMLDERLTLSLKDEAILSGRLESEWRFFYAALQGQVRHAEEGVRYPEWVRSILHRKPAPLLGCNFSCWREDLLRINGFDEDFVGAGGGEDDDVERRFGLIGLKAGCVRGAAICYHQYHKLVPRGPQAASMCAQKAVEGSSICQQGVREHAALTQAEAVVASCG